MGEVPNKQIKFITNAPLIHQNTAVRLGSKKNYRRPKGPQAMKSGVVPHSYWYTVFIFLLSLRHYLLKITNNNKELNIIYSKSADPGSPLMTSLS